MSIKKGKKQVYKVGSKVKVIRCISNSKAHTGRVGKIDAFCSDGAICVVFNKDESCDALEIKLISPLKPKKSKKHVQLKWYKRKLICGNCDQVKEIVTVRFGKTFEDELGEYNPICKFCGC